MEIDTPLQDREGALLVDGVVVDDVLGGVLESELANLRADGNALGDIAFADLEQILGRLLVVRVRALLRAAAVPLNPDPPDAAALS